MADGANNQKIEVMAEPRLQQVKFERGKKNQKYHFISLCGVVSVKITAQPSQDAISDLYAGRGDKYMVAHKQAEIPAEIISVEFLQPEYQPHGLNLNGNQIATLVKEVQKIIEEKYKVTLDYGSY